MDFQKKKKNPKSINPNLQICKIEPTPTTGPQIPKSKRMKCKYTNG